MKTIHYYMFLSIAFIPMNMGAMKVDADAYSLHEQHDEKNPIIDSNASERFAFTAPDGQSFNIPLNVALHAQFIKNYYEMGDYAYDAFQENNYIDLRSLPIDNGALNVSKAVVEKAFNCLKKGQKNTRRVTREKINDIFSVADFFGFPRKKNEKVTCAERKTFRPIR